AGEVPEPVVDVPAPDVAKSDNGPIPGGHGACRQSRGSGRVRQQAAPAAHRVGSVGGIEVELHQERAPADGVETKLELGDDAEVAASSAQAPEQVGVLRL